MMSREQKAIKALFTEHSLLIQRSASPVLQGEGHGPRSREIGARLVAFSLGGFRVVIGFLGRDDRPREVLRNDLAMPTAKKASGLRFFDFELKL
jgi:hypothetical protein